MTNTRLSKLQKWLLITAYKNNTKTVTKLAIYRDFYHIPCHAGKDGCYGVKAFFDASAGSAPPALSRSLRNLFEKGLIADPHFFFEIMLTATGIMKAKELLFIKKEE